MLLCTPLFRPTLSHDPNIVTFVYRRPSGDFPSCNADIREPKNWHWLHIGLCILCPTVPLIRDAKKRFADSPELPRIAKSTSVWSQKSEINCCSADKTKTGLCSPAFRGCPTVPQLSFKSVKLSEL
ncbi:hypothetical protein L596_027602 [Steinernema carpocapsae]|uniref:Uncharacterized protein n=1 Tax=Steinernema carpocapsae TaxID=34508 RepID=A0A4U5LVY9_STECR|nr:hypothetical protein L596_027602 [Steinernema carpocapsae]